MQEVNQKIR